MVSTSSLAKPLTWAFAGTHAGLGGKGRGESSRDRTMQEDTPLAPAQTMRLVILLPQNFLHSVLDRRGRVAC